MTIEDHPEWTVYVRTGAAALAVWFGALVAIPILAEPEGELTLVALSEIGAIRAIAAADVDLLNGSGHIYSVRGRGPGAVRQLYAAGGVIVLGGGGGGCRGLRRP